VFEGGIEFSAVVDGENPVVADGFRRSGESFSELVLRRPNKARFS
jgi:hypothetical protein